MCKYTHMPTYTYVVNYFTHCTGMHYILSFDIIIMKLYHNSHSVFFGCWCVQMSWSVRFRFLREDPRFVPCVIHCIQKRPRLPLQQSMLFMLENTAVSISISISLCRYQYHSMLFTLESTASNFFTGNNTALISLFSYLIFLSLLLYFSSYHLFCFILLYHLISAPKTT